ncbi:MAG: 1-deoxy-D-xylulose-5-phosphate reductoisomerase [Spirochaetaceae bacterium]|jgi:1-deoxy-D-xylulose-5-phosphate reductoisomerase|nr:1-deoxy-D-xylulose-5-phosphate reductoisomerase [Spirochaetaceae bacterium]
MKKRVALLGATGSIGKSTLDVIRQNSVAYELVLLTSHKDAAGLLALGREFPQVPLALSGADQEYQGIAYWGVKGLLRAIGECGGDIAVNGIAGAAGLEPSLAVLNAGMDLALANKETIVMAAPLVLALAAEKNCRIIPVDSEHAAIFNLLEVHGRDELDAILLTASGGPFRNYTKEQLASVSPKEALAHPTWNMGVKICIDSATLANKGLEVIEAARFFALPPEKITVVVHPQSIVHSMVRFKDGTVYAQLSYPDMRLPIQQALSYPVRGGASWGTLNFDALTLEFTKPDTTVFPMLPLAYEALKKGSAYPVVYNAANEIAVAAFLENRIPFLAIPQIVSQVLDRDWSVSPTIESIREIDSQARATCRGGVAAW